MINNKKRKSIYKNKTLLVLCLFSIIIFSFTVKNDNPIIRQLKIFSSIFFEISKNYVDEVDKTKLVEDGIEAITNTLDPYTEYIPESKKEEFETNFLTNEYSGIGVTLFFDKQTPIIGELSEGYPADKAGLLIGDKLISIDGNNVFGKKIEYISSLLRGSKETSVLVVVNRNGKEISKNIKRAPIKKNNISYFGIIENHIGYIKIDQFLVGTAQEFKEAIIELKKQKAKSLIVDLRNNGGGLMYDAISMVNMLVDIGQPIAFVKGRNPEDTERFTAKANPIDSKIPIVVLINENSASASEIFAGAMQDLDRGVVVGRTSYGKGLVQTTEEVAYNSFLKVTIAKYFTPSGRCIQRIDYNKKNTVKVDTAKLDSVNHIFYSKNKRMLRDNNGIVPDIYVAAHTVPDILYALHDSLLIFNYAINYKLNHKNLAKPETFKLSKDEYNNFIKFSQKNNFKFNTSSEDIIFSIKELLDKDTLSNNIESKKIIDSLVAYSNSHQSKDFEKYKNEIQMILENEIILHYYYEKGQIVHSFKYDQNIKAAINLLKNNVEYNNILNGVGVYSEIGKNSIQERIADSIYFSKQENKFIISANK